MISPVVARVDFGVKKTLTRAITKISQKKNPEKILKIVKSWQSDFPTEKFWAYLAQEYQETIFTFHGIKARSLFCEGLDLIRKVIWGKEKSGEI